MLICCSDYTHILQGCVSNVALILEEFCSKFNKQRAAKGTEHLGKGFSMSMCSSKGAQQHASDRSGRAIAAREAEVDGRNSMLGCSRRARRPIEDLAVPMHVTRQRYLVTPTSLARQKRSDLQILYVSDYY